MPRQTEKLSPLSVKRAKTPGYMSDGGGLYLQVAATRDPEVFTKSWAFRFTSPVTGKPREMGLGSINTWTLAEARQRAREQRQQIDQGIDPIQARDDQRAALAAQAAKTLTFKDATERFLAAKESEWKNAKHRAQWSSTLEEYAFKVIGNRPVHTIDVALVLKILQPIWAEKTETATRVRGRIERILDWATAGGYRTGDNPARWRGHLQSLLAAPAKITKVEHHPALSYPEIGAFMVDLGKQSGDAADALKLLILTATRTSEVIGASWAEIDFDAEVWTIPADRIKAGREHRIPLSAPALAVLDRRHKARADDGWIFPGVKGKPLSNNAILALLDRMDRGNITAHGFRSTFRDWAAEQTNFPREVAEMALAHAIPDKVEAAYRRGELLAKRTKMMEAWAAYALAGPRQGKKENVVSIGRKSA